MLIYDKNSKYFGMTDKHDIIKSNIYKVISSNNISKLKNIIIVDEIKEQDSAYGITLPYISNDNFYITIKFADILIDELLSDKNLEGIHIIHHELFHYLFLLEFYSEEKHLSFRKPGEEQITREDMLFDKGFSVYGEYYAFRNSFSSYVDINTKVLLNYYSKDSSINLEFFHQELSKTDTYNEICTLYSVINPTINKLFYSCCREIGYYHASNNIISKKEIMQLNNYDKFGNWILSVIIKLHDIYLFSVSELTIDDFISIGETFFSLYNNYGIQLINDDTNKIKFTII